MNILQQIENYIAAQPGSICNDMQALHTLILQVLPTGRLWFLDGKNSDNKMVSNPNIGYGVYNIKYTNGTSKEFYQIGLSANTTGISVYILGVADKTYLARTFGNKLGKAKVTGYCIKFRNLKDIDVMILKAAIHYGIRISGQN